MAVIIHPIGQLLLQKFTVYTEIQETKWKIKSSLQGS